MQRFTKFFLILMILSLIPLGGLALAQEPPEVDVFNDIVVPRLVEYNSNLPEHYGTIKIDALTELMMTEDLVFVDVREDTEIEDFGIIENAIHIPLRTLAQNLDLLPDLEAPIVVICKGGFRATIGMTALHVLGYENAMVLVGGFDAWVGAELPVVAEVATIEPAVVPESIDPLLVEYIDNYLMNLPEGWGAVKPAALFEEMFDTPPDNILDVRSDAEWVDPGYIDGAQHIWIDDFMAKQSEWPEDQTANIVVYCGSGYRAGVVSVIMGLMGYEDVRNMAGGMTGWLAEDLPVEVPEMVPAS
jgi:rhodanese-related sulfurtransferase